MIVAVDTNVLLDVYGADPQFGPRSKEALQQCLAEGRLVACEAVWAEVASSFPSQRGALDALSRLGVELVPMGAEAALAAGSAFKVYRARGGARQRVVADFLIGAHALVHADQLLTRDRGFYRSYFRKLRVLDPSVAS